MSDEYEQKIIKLKQELIKKDNRKKYFKCRTFLADFDIRRRDEQRIEKIEKLLEKYGIILYSKKGRSLLKMPQDDYITVESPKSAYAGEIIVEKGDNPRTLRPHQRDAVIKLNEKISNNKTFDGILVLPTGGGKTMTAVKWILENYIFKNKKVLWIAHRHELLEQAFHEFKNNAYSNNGLNKEKINIRIVSGIHDRPVNVKSTDDIIIASKDSINIKNGFNYLENKWLKHCNDELLLVIDEAHHAMAKTYRKLIDRLKVRIEKLTMLGLSATPYRTNKDEPLGYIFKDGIVYKIGLRDLIRLGFLSKPVFIEQKTGLDMTRDLTPEQLEKVNKFDIESIGNDIAKILFNNSPRNNIIVNHYLENRDKYGKTIVFAINIANAIALNALFKEKGVKSDFVVSSLRDLMTNANISPEENKRRIDRFRNGETEVIINVNILTEGVDLPNIQTVFLTRPTISTILMTQMIGRGLRGEEAGGTRNAYIVSFIDDWKDKIDWVSPDIYIVENVDIEDYTSESKEDLRRLISIAMIEDFARLLSGLDEDLEFVDFIERIPVGVYFFKLLETINEEVSKEKDCTILVYDNIKKSYELFIDELQSIIDKDDERILEESFLFELAQWVEEEYFSGIEKLPGYKIDDIKDLIKYYSITADIPKFINFEERNKFNIDELANEIITQELNPIAKANYIKERWNDEDFYWKAFFNYNLNVFINEIDLAIKRILYPELKPTPQSPPIFKGEDIDTTKLTMQQLREYKPEEWKKIRDYVFNNAKDSKGNFICAESGFRSPYKYGFQIHHIIPLSEGGLTVVENLQLLKRSEHIKKHETMNKQ